MRISDWSSDVCSSDLLSSGERFRRILTLLRRQAASGRLAYDQADCSDAGNLGHEVSPEVRFGRACRSEEQTSELQSLMRRSYAGFFLKKTRTQAEPYIVRLNSSTTSHW